MIHTCVIHTCVSPLHLGPAHLVDRYPPLPFIRTYNEGGPGQDHVRPPASLMPGRAGEIGQEGRRVVEQAGTRHQGCGCRCEVREGPHCSNSPPPAHEPSQLSEMPRKELLGHRVQRDHISRGNVAGPGASRREHGTDA